MIELLLFNKDKKIGECKEMYQEHFERFAWRPKRMYNKKLVWLKKYIEVRHYVDAFMLLTANPPHRYYCTYFTPADYTLYLLKGKDNVWTD